MSDEPPPQNYSPDDTILRFEEVRVLGVGGLSKVLHVKDKHNDMKDLALKVLSKDAKLDRHTRSRFVSELEILCSIDHKNIIKAHELVVYRGHDAYTMELVKGRDLAAYFKDGSVTQFSFTQIESIIVQLLEALEEIHKRDIVHRDIKPENILITPDGTIKLSDFGFSKYLREDPRTDPGYVLGTVSYVAPEYYLNQILDAQADIYSCGVIMWELLRGARRFPGLDGEQVIRSLNATNFSHPDIELPQEQERLSQILKKAVAFNKEERFQSAREMREAFGKSTSTLQGQFSLSRIFIFIGLTILLGLVFFYLHRS